MAQTKYTYSVATDTANAAVAVDALKQEYENSAIITALDYISVFGDVLDIYTKDALSTGDKTLLDAVVAAHAGVALSSPDQVEVSNEISIAATPPFAEPDYRTKRDATSSWETVSAGTNKIIDFVLSEERYVTGGEIIFKNAKEGDYISAEVYDKDNVIPEAYRAALCESHPSVAKYIIKKWLMPTEADKYGSFLIDTYPLNAKISAGLYLRVTYHPTAETGDRKVAINYHLTKKL